MSAITALGLVRIADLEVAVPATLISEIVAGPIDVSPFPAAPRHVRGAFARHGSPVPVLDLAALLGRDREPSVGNALGFALIIRLPRGRFAVEVDAVLGVVRPAEKDVTDVDASPGEVPALFDRLYTHPVTQRVSAILDLEAILRIHELHTAIDAGPVTDPGAEIAGRGSFLTFLLQGRVYAFAMGHVRHVGLRTGELDSALQGRIVRGFHRVQESTLPVVDLLALLGTAPAGASSPLGPCFLVVEKGGRSFAVCVDQLKAIETVAADRIDPVSALGRTEAKGLRGSFVDRHGQVVLVADADDLLARIEVVDQGTRPGDAVSSGLIVAAASPPVHQLVYRVGTTRLATPLASLHAVLHVPETRTDTRGEGGAAVGFCTQGGRTVSLIDLACLLGRDPVPLTTGQPVLVVDGGEGLRGYVVEAIEFMQLASLLPLPFPDRSFHGVIPPFTQMIRARGDGRDFAACVLDLARLPAHRPAGETAAFAA